MRTSNIVLGYAVGVLAFILSGPFATAATASIARSNGLLLECSLLGGASWRDVEVICRLSNETAVAIYFSSVTQAGGFVPQLLKADGSKVPMTEKLEKLIPDFDFGSGKLSGGWLQAGRPAVFRFKLLDGFRLDDPTGCILRLSWDPGFEGNIRRRPDKHLVAELKVPDLKTLHGGEVREASASAAKVVGDSEAREAAKTGSVENQASRGNRLAPENSNAQFQFGYLLLAVGLLVGTIVLFKTVRTKLANRERE